LSSEKSKVFPLAAYGGQAPRAPEWFAEAVQNVPAPQFITVDGTPIESYVWGPAGAPGILFMHGNRGHAGWWNFLAPAFAATHRVASISWSGMGGSGWRERYSIEQHVREAQAAAESAGLFSATRAPVLVAHSFGARVAVRCARLWGGRLAGCIVVDAALHDLQLHSGSFRADRKVYASEEEALARFRFAPSQRCVHPYIADFLARGALMRIQDPAGWTWRFDPAHAMHMAQIPDQADDLRQAACPLAFIYASQSPLTPLSRQQAHRTASPPDTLFVNIADAGHHVMVDQPLVLRDELRSIIDRWSLSERRDNGHVGT
jgi:pimeloyl-ACP methyl ester carboxylesterase